MKQKDMYLLKLVGFKPSRNSTGCEAAYRLGESHTGDRSVEHSHPDHMERVEAHRVPNTNMRGQQLNGQVTEMKSGKETACQTNSFDTWKQKSGNT